MSEQNKAVVRRVIEEHYNGKNAALVGELFAPSLELQTPDGVISGLDGASALLQTYATAFPDFHISIDDLVAEGEKVVFRYTFTGTNRGPLGETPATGKYVDIPNAIGIYRVTDGKVSEGHLAWDRFALMQALGLLPA